MPTAFQPKSEFPLLDLVAQLEFETPGSAGFCLGTYGNVISISSGVEVNVGEKGVFNVCGSVAVHYPCDNHIKVQVSAELPEQYRTFETMHEFVQQLFAAVGIPSDETFTATFRSGGSSECIEQADDRDGYTDRIYSF